MRRVRQRRILAALEAAANEAKTEAPTVPPDKLRAALIARVSTMDQNCQMQIGAYREFVERHGWSSIKEYVDIGWSGAKAARPALLELKADAQKHRFDVVVAWSLDRFGRSTLDCLEGIQKLSSQGIRFVTITQNIDTDQSNPYATFMLTILAAVAQLEREMIKERVMAGIKNYRSQYAAGKVGKGKTAHSRSGKDLPVGRPRLVFDREQARNMRKRGFSIRQIMETLHLSSWSVQKALSGVRKPGLAP